MNFSFSLQSFERIFLGNNYPGVVFPSSDAIFYAIHCPGRQQKAAKQRVRPNARTTKRRLATTLTTRRTAKATVTVRGNNVKSGVRKPVQTQKKPLTNNHVQN